MNELARLGVSMDTKPLQDGKAALDALVPSAQRAEKATEKFNKAAAGITASGGIKSFTTAATGATTASDRLSKAALGTGTAMRTVQAAAAGASAPINNLVGGLTRVSVATGQADAHIQAYRNSLATVPAAANAASTSLARLGAAANDNINRLQSTPGNIAAQFQDIGVTAAGGMNPLLIALQQGTQLSSAMQGGIANLLAGFRQLFSLTTVLTVALVGLVAAGLQAVDWMRVGEVLANGLANGLDMLAGFVNDASVALLYFAGVSLVAFGPRILASLLALTATMGGTLVTAISTATLAMISFSLANPFGAIVIAIGVVIAAMTMLNEKFGGVFTGILKVVKYVANAIIRFFATAFNSVLQVAQNTVNGIISAFEGVAGFLGMDVKVGRVDLSGVKIDTAVGRDFVGDIGAGISGAISRGADMARGLFAPDGSAVPAAAAGAAGRAAGRGGAAASAAGGQTDAERQAEAYEQLTKRAQERINALTDETMALGMTEAAGARFLAQQALLRDAASQGIELDVARRQELMKLGEALASAEIDKQIAEQTRAYQEQMQALQDQSNLIGLTGRELTQATAFQRMLNDAVSSGAIDLDNMTDAMLRHVQVLRERAAALADVTEANRTAEFITDFTRDLDLQTAALERSRGEIGLTGAALTAYRIESDLLNEAARQNIALSPQDIDGIRKKAVAYGEMTEEIRRQREWTDLSRQSIRGFFGDMVANLQQGQNAWQAFGNAVMNVVNRIIDRLLDLAAEQAFSQLIGAFAGGNAGVKGGGNVKGLSGGKSSGGLTKFANGGVFTNGIYSDPTLFKFAKGGAFGMMGEAGPEAVMPLKRGSDGSLGVKVQAMEPHQVVIRVVTDDERFDAYVDTRISQSAPQVAEAGSIIRQREDALMQTRRLR